ncbi:hypothetical protein NUW58_g6686 [Xylaria curta]|uniref:Uncharacterized protein n=1 Tax=Xylaria curta TaxID=42375 RepID=A0ACC1NS83_9PEZI|nr:hypothetical protein NUW58_g6686 [Xylaria curta]
MAMPSQAHPELEKATPDPSNVSQLTRHTGAQFVTTDNSNVQEEHASDDEIVLPNAGTLLPAREDDWRHVWDFLPQTQSTQNGVTRAPSVPYSATSQAREAFSAWTKTTGGNIKMPEIQELMNGNISFVSAMFHISLNT